MTAPLDLDVIRKQHIRLKCDGPICRNGEGYCERCEQSMPCDVSALLSALEATREALTIARGITYRMYGDIEEPGDHYEECLAADEDAHCYAVHAADCEFAPGQRAGLWHLTADQGCCDMDSERDVDEMLAACDCHIKELHGLVTLADAALALVAPSEDSNER